jgi:hypothetical protein
MTKYLYRKAGRAVTLMALVAGISFSAWSQPPLPQMERTTSRAVAVLETDASGAQRLIPITLFYERHYYDAALYRATPVPLTLVPQTVYEVQQAGKPVGLFTVLTARQSDGQWVASGKYEAATESGVRKKRSGQPPEDPARPVLHRREGSEGDDLLEAAEGTRSQLTAGETAVNAMDSERPVLRRAKPAEEIHQGNGDESRAGEVVTRRVAVSDAGTERLAPSLLFLCSAEEKETMHQQAQRLAMSELKLVAAARGIPVEKLGPPTEEDFRAYRLEQNEYATMVYSARFAPAEAAARRERGWMVTVIVRAEGVQFARLYAAISDPRELELYPEVQPVDLVDAEGLGHYLLLLRESGAGGVRWRLGRITGYEMQTVFMTAER